MFRWACVGLLACGCATTVKVTHDDNTDLIDREMRREVFTDATPGAQGIVLGPDAPPLAPVPIAEADNTWGHHYSPYGYGWGGPGYIGGVGRGVHVSYPNLPGADGQPFGGGTAGGGPHPGSGGNFTGGTAGGSPHGGSGIGGHGIGGRGGGGHGGGGHGR